VRPYHPKIHKTMYTSTASSGTPAATAISACCVPRINLLVSIPTRFAFGRIATSSTAAAAAALTLSLSPPVAAIPRHDATDQGAQHRATSPASHGGLRGTIRDFGTRNGLPGDPMPRVTITARDQKKGLTFTALSATDGTYEMLLPKGRYDVLMLMTGFVKCQVDGVDIGSSVVVADANLAPRSPDASGDVIVTEPPVARQGVPVVREKVVTGCNNPELDHLAHKSTGWK